MTIRYLIISILFIAVSFFIGYSINPYGAHENMKNQMVYIVLPNGEGHAGSRSDTIFIADYIQHIKQTVLIRIHDSQYEGGYFYFYAEYEPGDTLYLGERAANPTFIRELHEDNNSEENDSLEFWLGAEVEQNQGFKNGYGVINTYVWHHSKPPTANDLIFAYYAHDDSTRGDSIGQVTPFSRDQHITRYKKINDSVAAVEYERGMQILKNLYRIKQN